eukprot:SAG11_NODE_4231_length_1998_cov_1.757241_1_plen_79_part_10
MSAYDIPLDKGGPEMQYSVTHTVAIDSPFILSTHFYVLGAWHPLKPNLAPHLPPISLACPPCLPARIAHHVFVCHAPPW